jgi:hypothetical protein
MEIDKVNALLLCRRASLVQSKAMESYTHGGFRIFELIERQEEALKCLGEVD